MDWDALGAIGDFVGGLAVIAGLFFVGVQLMMANREARVSANQKYSESIVGLGKLIGENEQTAGLFVRGLSDLNSLNPDERVWFIVQVGTNILRTWENLYLHNQEGRLDQHLWHGAEKMLGGLVATKGFREVWQIRRDWYSVSFQAFIDELIAAGSDVGLLQHYGLEPGQ